MYKFPPWVESISFKNVQFILFEILYPHQQHAIAPHAITEEQHQTSCIQIVARIS